MNRSREFAPGGVTRRMNDRPMRSLSADRISRDTWEIYGWDLVPFTVRAATKEEALQRAFDIMEERA